MSKHLNKLALFFFLVPLLGTFSTGYAASCSFSDDLILKGILTGTSNGKPCVENEALYALAGHPDAVCIEINRLCDNKETFPEPAQQIACQTFYKQAYYGKIQTACHYITAFADTRSNTPSAPSIENSTATENNPGVITPIQATSITDTGSAPTNLSPTP